MGPCSRMALVKRWLSRINCSIESVRIRFAAPIPLTTLASILMPRLPCLASALDLRLINALNRDVSINQSLIKRRKTSQLYHLYCDYHLQQELQALILV
jgi:hypothetical protein